MDPNLLQQFRHQLATWIDQQMGTQRLPFRRLEICPRLLTEHGRQAPDLVLWVNRDTTKMVSREHSMASVRKGNSTTPFSTIASITSRFTSKDG